MSGTPNSNTPATPGAGSGNTAWHAGLDQEHLGHAQGKGWHTLTPEAAAIEAVKAHRAAERALGVPADRVLRLPDKPDAPEWAGVYERLGVPKAAADYKIEGVKFADGTDVGDAFAASVREIAYKLHLPAAQATTLAQSIVALADQDAADERREQEAALSAGQTELSRLWGASMEHNKFLAARGAELLGIDGAAALAATVGFVKAHEICRELGSRMSEPDLHRGGSGPNIQPYQTTAQAADAIDKLKADPAWVKRFIEGDAAARKELHDLTVARVGPPPPAR